MLLRFLAALAARCLCWGDFPAFCSAPDCSLPSLPLARGGADSAILGGDNVEGAPLLQSDPSLELSAAFATVSECPFLSPRAR